MFCGLDLGTTNINTGFPFTTGRVYVKATDGPLNTTFTATGVDARTALGVGQITLVAGGLQHRVGTAGVTAGMLETVAMTVTFPAQPLPSITPAGIAAGAVLMVLAVGYALRRRF